MVEMFDIGKVAPTSYSFLEDENIGGVVSPEADYERSMSLIAMGGYTEDQASTEADRYIDLESEQYQITFDVNNNVAEEAVRLSETALKMSRLVEHKKYSPESYLTLGSPDYNPDLVNYYVNMETALRVVGEHSKQISKDTSVLGKGFTWLDENLLRATTVGAWEAFSGRGKRDSRADSQALLTLSPKELELYINDRLSEARREGILASDSEGSVERVMKSVVGGGFDPEAKLKISLAMLDAIGLGSTRAVRGALKALRTEKLPTSVLRTGRDLIDEERSKVEALFKRNLPPSANPSLMRTIDKVTAPPKYSEGSSFKTTVTLGSPLGPRLAQKQLATEASERVTAIAANAQALNYKAATSAAVEGLVTRIGRVAGPDVAAEAAARMTKLHQGVSEVAQREAGPAAYNPSSPVTSGQHQANITLHSRLMKENSIVQSYKDLVSSQAIPRVMTDEEAVTLGATMAAKVAKDVSMPFAQFNTRLDDLGLEFVHIDFGLADDAAKVLTRRQADSVTKDIREKGLDAVTWAVDPTNEKLGFYSRVVEPMVPSKGVGKLDLTEPFRLGNTLKKVYAKAFASTNQLDEIGLQNIANLAEGASGAVRQLLNPYLNVIKKTSYIDRVTVNKVMTDLRDNPSKNWEKHWYTPDKFRIEFKKAHPEGKFPSTNAEEAYMAAVTISDADYILKSGKMLRRYHEAGLKGLYGYGDSVIAAKTVTAVKVTSKILDMTTGTQVSLAALRENTVVWQSVKEIDGYEFFVKPKTVGNLNYWDVLDYNAGGPRLNQQARFFIATVDKVSGASKRAIMTAFSEKEAKLAATQMEAIRGAMAGRALSEIGSSIDNVILANNKWNPQVVDGPSLKKWSDDNDWTWDEKISSKPRGGPTDSQASIDAGMSNEDVMMFNLKRGQTLPSFGGAKTFNEDPMTNIADSFVSASHEYTFRRASHRAKVAWLKQHFRDDNGYEKALKGSNIDDVFNTQFNSLKGVDTPTRRLLEIGSIIKRRDQTSGAAGELMDNYGGRTTDFVFDNFGLKLKIGDPINKILNTAFHTTLGLGNISQFMMQSSQMFAISALSPIHGTKAGALAIPMRIVLNTADSGGRHRVGKLLGLSASETDDLFTYIHQSGRLIVENDHILKGTGSGSGFGGAGSQLLHTNLKRSLFEAGKVGSKVLDVGLVPFNQGETLSRITAMTTAFLEHKTKNPGVKALSREGREGILRREQDLTFNMVRSSRAAFQQGAWRVPTQFMSYTMRAFESVVLGRGFTPMERVRLSIVLAAQGGIAGAGFTHAADSVADMWDVDPNSPGFAAIQYGFVDGIMSWGLQGLTETDAMTAMGSRLSPVGGLVELVRGVSYGAPLSEMATGAAGSILGAPISSLMTLVGGLSSGDTASAKQALTALIRTPSQVNSLYKAAEIYMLGNYSSKSGNPGQSGPTPENMRVTEAVMQALGVSNFTPAYFAGHSSAGWRSWKDSKAYVKELAPMWREVNRLAEEGMYAQSNELGEQLYNRIQGSHFDPLAKSRILKEVMKGPDLNYRLYLAAITPSQQSLSEHMNNRNK